MIEFPKIKGITWMDGTAPDIVGIDVVLVHRLSRDLGLKEVPTEPSVVYIDLSKLAGVRNWYPEGEDEPSEIECSVDVDGVDNFIASVPIKNMLEAWRFNKRFHYARK